MVEEHLHEADFHFPEGVVVFLEDSLGSWWPKQSMTVLFEPNLYPQFELELNPQFPFDSSLLTNEEGFEEKEGPHLPSLLRG
jgi:hypothetical protein